MYRSPLNSPVMTVIVTTSRPTPRAFAIARAAAAASILCVTLHVLLIVRGSIDVDEHAGIINL